MSTAIVGLLGIFTAAASQTAYGQVEWNPIVIVGYWSESGSHGGRAASAFGAIGLLIVTLGINISANSISAANDLVSFCPKYINIRRVSSYMLIKIPIVEANLSSRDNYLPLL